MTRDATFDAFATETITLVLIDDDREDYLLTKEILSECEGAHFVMDWVDNCEEGLALILEARHDLYLIDYRLGAENGLDLLRRAIDQGCQSPLIILTGQGDREVDLEAMRAGAADYLVKDQIDAPLLERSLRYSIERRRSQEEREKLIAELQDALTKIKTLKGLVPICSYCKKIRDDKGYWSQVEEYIRDRTDADFTHGLCPDCYDTMMKEIDETYPEKDVAEPTA